MLVLVGVERVDAVASFPSGVLGVRIGLLHDVPEKLFGIASGHVLGRPLRDLLLALWLRHEEEDESVERALAECLSQPLDKLAVVGTTHRPHPRGRAVG